MNPDNMRELRISFLPQKLGSGPGMIRPEPCNIVEQRRLVCQLRVQGLSFFTKLSGPAAGQLCDGLFMGPNMIRQVIAVPQPQACLAPGIAARTHARLLNSAQKFSFSLRPQPRN